MAVKMLTVIINDPQGQMSKEQVEQAVISTGSKQNKTTLES